ncbi:MAG: cation transporter [Christensenellaceae bacterium]|jgi:copper chaperone CopZ|nr:cation transporter [Christensenellaceae bacterium]
MKKVVSIEGMSCEHCKASVIKALDAITGVKAKVDLKKGIAKVNIKRNSQVSDDEIKQAIVDAGFTIKNIEG